MALNLLACLVIVVIIVAAAAISYAVLSSNTGGINVSNPTALALSTQPRMISSAGVDYELVLNKADSATGRAYVYLYSVPILVGRAYNVTLNLNQTTHINAGTQYANLGIVLKGLTNKSLNLTVFEIEQYSNTEPDAMDIAIVSQAALLGRGAGAPGVATTTASQGTGASTTITQHPTISTTTIPINSTPSQIVGLAAKSDIYGLMLNYTKLYASESSCTSALYNSSYLTALGSLPYGLPTYANVSAQTPYQLYSNTTNMGSGSYKITFYDRIHIPALDNKIAAAIVVNLKTDAVSSSLSGIYAGQDYTSLYENYTRALTFGNGCGVFLVAVGG